MSAPIRLDVPMSRDPMYLDSMSLDGYVAGPDDRAGQELGRGGGRLFDWLDDRTAPGINGQVYGEPGDRGRDLRTAHLRARRSVERRPPRRGPGPRADLRRRRRRRAPGHREVLHRRRRVRRRGTGAAGDRAVMVHGASAAHALLQAGRLDELEIHLVPVLPGAGRRLFEDRTDRVELELVRRLDGRDVTHLRYRVRR